MAGRKLFELGRDCAVGLGDAALKKWVDQAEGKGIIVTSQNTELPTLFKKYNAKGFGYVGQNLYNSGVLLGTSAVSQLHLKKGDRAMVWGLLSQPTPLDPEPDWAALKAQMLDDFGASPAS